MTRFSWVAGLTLAALAGCGPIVQVGGNSPRPPVLYTLDAEPAAAPSAARLGRLVIVEQPAVVGKLQTLRVPVTTADTRIAYLVGAEWAENPARLVQRVIVDRMNAAGLTAVGPGVRNVGSTRLVSSTLREFGLDVRDRAQPVAQVRIDAVLSDETGKLIAARQFIQAAPLAGEEPDLVIEGLNRATNLAAAEMVRWVAAN